jgi:hypothetical protein
MEDAYVINLKTSVDRWADIQKRFEGTCIRLHRVDPVPVNSVSMIKGVIPSRRERVRRMRSLALSFLKIIKMAKRKNLPEVLILEDDCAPFEGFESNWALIKSFLREHKDKCELYAGGVIHIRDPFLIGYNGPVKLFRPKECYCSQWMWAMRESYDAIIKLYTDELKKNIIVATDSLNLKLKLVISHPFVSYQLSKKSTLTGKTIKGNDRFIKNSEGILLRQYSQTRKLYLKEPKSHNTRRNTRRIQRVKN